MIFGKFSFRHDFQTGEAWPTGGFTREKRNSAYTVVPGNEGERLFPPKALGRGMRCYIAFWGS